MNKDWMRTITAVEPRGEAGLFLRWSDGTEAEIMLKPRIRAALGDNANFAAVRLGDWGHGIEWPSGFDLGADSLWADTLSATGRDDARTFLEWRRSHGFSLQGAAEALGISRRTAAYYSNGERPVPKTILLACKGWDSLHAKRRAA